MTDGGAGSTLFATEQNDITKRLFLAVSYKENEFVERLLRSSERSAIDLNGRDNNGYTCLGRAATEGNLALVKILVEVCMIATPTLFAVSCEIVDIMAYAEWAKKRENTSLALALASSGKLQLVPASEHFDSPRNVTHRAAQRSANSLALTMRRDAQRMWVILYGPWW